MIYFMLAERGVTVKVDYNISILRSARRTVSLEIRADDRIILRAPLYMTDEAIDRFIKEKSGWIDKHMSERRAKEQEKADVPPKKLSREEINELADKAVEKIPPKAERFAAMLGVTYGGITIRCQKTRWGSCSSAGNLNFNCLLMLCPERVIDYVIIHELCHRKEMNHSKSFWAEVERAMPDYKEAKAWLKNNGGVLMAMAH